MDGWAGIRHENIMIVREADVEHRFGDVQYLAFEHITFMPFQTSMLELALLAPAELLWLNQYHQECRDKVLPLLAGNDAGCKWLLAATEPVVVP
jgi:Xaa-Pro aminopeptidase